MKKKYTKKPIILRASQAEIWMNCSGYAHNEAQENIYANQNRANDGTIAHGILAEFLELGKKVKLTKKQYAAMAEERGVDSDFIYYAVEACNIILAEFELIKKRDKTARLEIEKRYEHVWQNVTITGQFDVAIIAKGFCKVFDFKSGMGQVIAKNNKQLKTYILLSATAYEKQLGNGKIEFIGGIIQPPLGVIEQDVFNGEYPITQLNNLAKEVANGNKEYVVGKHCKWCPFNDLCPTLKKQIEAFLSPEFSGEIFSRPEKWRELLELSSAIENLIKTVKDKAKMYLETGLKIEGVMLGTRHGKRFWVDGIGDKEIAKAAGVKLSDISEVKLLNPTEVLKMAKNPEDLIGLYGQGKYPIIKTGGEDDLF